MAVDIKTLHIGSHVEYSGKRVCVDEIKTLRLDGEPMRLLVSHNGLVYGNPSIDEVEPIPITPDLLGELGFQYRDNTYWERWFLGSFDIERKEGSSYFDYNSEIRLEYLHELESLYYMIYGVELIKE